MTAPFRPDLGQVKPRPGPAYNPGVSVGGGAIPAMPPKPAAPAAPPIPPPPTVPQGLRPPTPGGGAAQPFVQPPVNAGAMIQRPAAPPGGFGGFQNFQLPPGIQQRVDAAGGPQGIMAMIRNRLGGQQPGGSPGLVTGGVRPTPPIGMGMQPQNGIMDRIRQYFQNRGGAGG